METTGGSNLYGFTFNKTYIIDFLGLLTDEELYECINIKVTTKIKWLIILNEEIEWKPGKENAITTLGYDFFRYPSLILSVQWKETNKCKCVRKNYKGTPSVEYSVFLIMPDNSVVQKFMPGCFIRNTLLGIPFMGEVTQARAVGYNNTAIGRVVLGIGRKAAGVRLYILVGTIEAIHDTYYI